MKNSDDALLDFLDSDPTAAEGADHDLISRVAALVAEGKPVLSGADAKLINAAGNRMSEAARLRIGLTWREIRGRRGPQEIVAPQLWLNLRGRHLPQPISERAARAYVELWMLLAHRYARLMPRTEEHQWLMRVFAKRAHAVLQRCEECQGYFRAERLSAVYCSARCRKAAFLARQRTAALRRRRVTPRAKRKG